MAQQEVYGSYLTIVTNVTTRWFSNYYLLCRILELSNEIDGIIKAESEIIKEEYRESFIKEFTLGSDEKMMINYFVGVIKKLLDECNILSSETIPTMSYSISLIRKLKEELKEMSLNLEMETTDVTLEMNSFVIRSNERQFTSLIDFEESGFNTNDIIEYSFNGIEQNVHDCKIQFLECLISSIESKFFDGNNNILKVDDVLVSNVLNPVYKGDFLLDDELEYVKDLLFGVQRTSVNSQQMSQPGRKIRAVTNDEFDTYIKESCIDEKSTFGDIVCYWEDNRNRFPVLYSNTRKYFSYLVASSASERLFSHAGGYYSARRTRMFPSHLEDMCILNSFFSSEGIDSFKGMNFKK